MKSVLIMIIICLVVSTTFCHKSKSTIITPDKGNVSFMISSNHFVKNFYLGETNPSYLLIRNYSSFDSLFGVAATMDMDELKLITQKKMESGFVFSIIYQGNDIHEFDIEKILLEESQLLIYYTSEVVMPNASWECNCHITLLINNCDFDDIFLYENGNLLTNTIIKKL